MTILEQAQELGRIIHFHRKQSGLSQLELAKLAGVGKAVVFDIEHGKATVQLDTILKLLATLNVQIEFRSPLMERFRRDTSEETVE